MPIQKPSLTFFLLISIAFFAISQAAIAESSLKPAFSKDVGTGKFIFKDGYYQYVSYDKAKPIVKKSRSHQPKTVYPKKIVKKVIKPKFVPKKKIVVVGKKHIVKPIKSSKFKKKYYYPYGKHSKFSSRGFSKHSNSKFISRGFSKRSKSFKHGFRSNRGFRGNGFKLKKFSRFGGFNKFKHH